MRPEHQGAKEMCRRLFLTIGITLLLPQAANAQGKQQQTAPAAHIDNSLLNALNPANDVPPPGAIVANPDKPPPSVIPETPTMPASSNLPSPEQIVIDPSLAKKTEILPVPTQNDIVRYPITQHITTETIDPGAPTTAPAPTPDLAKSLAPAVKTPKNSAIKQKFIKIKTIPTKKITAPPLPRHRPAIIRASKAFLDKEQNATTSQPVRPIKLSPRPSAGPSMPAVAALNVDAVPLQDMLHQKMSLIGKAQMVETIKEINANKEGVSNAPIIHPPSMPAPTSPSQPVVVRTQAQMLPPQRTDATNLSSAIVAPGMPHPPPPDAREKDYLTLAYNIGTLQPNATNITVLQSKVLPMLKANPRWRVQIQAFAEPQGKELISARRISLSRALALRSWLMDHGIEPQRMDLRALGIQSDRNPLDRIDLVFFDPDK